MELIFNNDEDISSESSSKLLQEEDQQIIIDEPNININDLSLSEITKNPSVSKNKPEMINFHNTHPPINELFMKMTPIQLFEYLFNDFIEYICKCSENCTNKRYGIKINFTKDNIYKYLYVYIFLSGYNYHEIEELWEKKNLIKTNCPNIISRNKHREINKYFILKLVFKQYLKDKNKCFGLKFFTKNSSDKWHIYHISHIKEKDFNMIKKSD